MIEGMPAVVTVLTEVEVNFSAPGQPECGVLLGKRNGAVFDHLMFAEELNLGYGADHFGLDAHDLKFISRDPRSAFQADGVILVADSVVVHAAGTVVALAEVH